MNFLQTRNQQLTEYLRDQIFCGELVEPLPSTRLWAKQLGVGCNTLYRSLDILKREKLISIHERKGVSLVARRRPALAEIFKKRVRILVRKRDYPEGYDDSYYYIFNIFTEQLQVHDIQLSMESCTDARLRAFCKQDNKQHTDVRELLILRSFSEEYQRLFADSGKAVLLFGQSAPEVSLPCINFDTDGAVRHATNRLLHRGFKSLYLLSTSRSIPGIQRNCDTFTTVCETWHSQPIDAEIVRVPLRLQTEIAALCRFVSRIKERKQRCGIIVLTPVSAVALITTLLKYGVNYPEETEVNLIGRSPGSSFIFPVPVHYLSSDKDLSHACSRIAVNFFETGTMPKVSKVIPMEKVNMARPE